MQKNKIIDFSFNVNQNIFFDFSKLSVDYLKYPDYKYEKEKLILSNYFSLENKNFYLGNGSTEIFKILAEIYANKKTLIVSPTFWEYEFFAKRYTKEIDFFISLDNFNYINVENKLKNFEIIYLCNPNNPTSFLYDRTKLLKIFKKHLNKIFIIDETYLFFLNQYEQISFKNEISKLKNIIIVLSLSKFFNLGGLRGGIAISSKENIKKLKLYGIPYSFNNFLAMQLKYLFNKEKINFFRNSIEIEKKKMIVKISKLKYLKIINFQANFLFIEINNLVDINKFRNFMEKNQIILRYGSEFKNLESNYIRISINEKINNDYLINILNQFEIEYFIKKYLKIHEKRHFK